MHGPYDKARCTYHLVRLIMFCVNIFQRISQMYPKSPTAKTDHSKFRCTILSGCIEGFFSLRREEIVLYPDADERKTDTDNQVNYRKG